MPFVWFDQAIATHSLDLIKGYAALLDRTKVSSQPSPGFRLLPLDLQRANWNKNSLIFDGSA
ncbi:hypothetical protein [Alloprevotella tannerae]|uniref:hypothetical protein n=1 Tax=Alloprevotella tannerae TaxID=76122 RepID=UPI0028E20B38|nr:hypothetical protein [Alloprevotella tannerae]